MVSFFDDLTKPKMEKQIQQRQHAKDIASKNLSRVEARDINAMKLLSTEEAYNAKLEHLIVNLFFFFLLQNSKPISLIH